MQMNSKVKTTAPMPKTDGMIVSEFAYTEPGADALNAYQANLRRWIADSHEEYVLTDPAVAEGISVATSLIDEWRGALK